MLRQDWTKGDTLSLFAVRLLEDGEPIDLTGRVVKFVMYNANGGVKVTENTAHVTVSNATNGDVEYDFQAGDVDTAGVFSAYFKIYNGDESESQTWPNEDGIQFTISDPAAPQSAADPDIDIVGMANAPGRTRTVEGTVEERSMNELIKADQYAASKAAAAAGQPWGIRFARTRPGGTTT